MSRPTPLTYRTRNWPAYNEALKRRGSLTIWFDPGMTWDAAPTGRRGRQQTYSDAAIQTCLSMKVLFGMALRQTTGFVESLLKLVGLGWAVPDFSTLSRRQKTLAVNIPYRGSNGGFADRLRKAGKPHKVIITAVARKLGTIANALCKNRQKWAAPATRQIQLLGRVDKRDSQGGLNLIQAGIWNGDQLGTRPDVGRGVGVS